MNISEWVKKRAKKKEAKQDLIKINATLSYINHCSRLAADVGAQFKRRYALGGDAIDYEHMAISDTTTVDLKRAYGVFYAIKLAKQDQLKGREPRRNKIIKPKGINQAEAKGPTIKLKAKGSIKNGRCNKELLTP